MTIFDQYGKLFGDMEHGEIYFFGTVIACFIILMLLILIYLCLCRNIGKRRQSIELPPRKPDPVTITCIQMLEGDNPYDAPLDATQSTSHHGMACKSGCCCRDDTDRQKRLDQRMAQFARTYGSNEFMSAREYSRVRQPTGAGGRVETRDEEACGLPSLPDCVSNSKCDLPTPMPARSGEVPFGMSPMPTRSSRTRTPDTLPTKAAQHHRRRDNGEHRDDDNSSGESSPPNKMVK